MKTKELHILCRSEQKSEKMKSNLLFLNGCYPKESDNYFVNNSNVMPQNAANVLAWRIIEGLELNIPGRFKVLTCPFIGYYPKGFKKLFIKDSIWSHNGKDKDQLLGFINIKGLETWIKSVRVYKYVKKWYKLSKENRHMLIYSHYAGFMRAAGKIKRHMPDMHITCLVTDMNEMDERKDLMGIKGKIKGIPRAIMIRITYKNLKYISSFVLLAEKMKEYLKVGTRPYIVVEGIAAPLTYSKIVNNGKFIKKEKEFRVVYTGTLHKRYGAVMLAEAFLNQKVEKNMTLYVCGSGDGEYIVKALSEKAPNIHYLGVVAHEDAIALQESADLLVNSMPNFGIHTALSFPSKTMEYMIMGKPMACFKVEGIPDEYDEYLMYFEEETAESIAKKVNEIAKLPKETLTEIGRKNNNFVKTNKNPLVQVKRILDMLDIDD